MKIFMKNNKKGFTIVECIVAIAVIAIITSSAVGVFHSAQTTENKEWDKFTATTVADNAVSAFQSAEDLDSFAAILPDGVTQLGSAVDGESSSTPVPIPFKTVRAYESGKVEFFNKTLNINTENVTGAIATFDYSGNADAYKNDVRDSDDSLDKSGVYTKSEHTVSEPGDYVLSAPSSVNDRSSDVVMTYTGTSMILDVDYSSWGLGWMGSEDRTFNAENEYTDFEKYLWDNKLIAAIPNNLDAKDTIYSQGYSTSKYEEMFFYLYRINDDGTLTVDKNPSNSKQYHAICLHIEKNQLNGVIAKDEISSKKIKILGVYEAYVTKEGYQNDIQSIDDPDYKTEFKGKNGETFKNFEWGGLPLFAYFCHCEDGSRVSPHYDEIRMSISQGATSLLYTDYSLVDSSDAIYKALYKSDETKLYSSDKLLFKYTGGDAKSMLTGKLGMTKRGTEDGCDKYQKVEETVSDIKTGYFWYLQNGSDVGCFMQVTYSDSYNEDRSIKVWILQKSDIDTLKNNGTEGIESLIPAKTPDFTYKKG